MIRVDEESRNQIMSTFISALAILMVTLVGTLYSEVKANTSQNELDKEYNQKLMQMNERLIRIDENVLELKRKVQ